MGCFNIRLIFIATKEGIKIMKHYIVRYFADSGKQKKVLIEWKF